MTRKCSTICIFDDFYCFYFTTFALNIRQQKQFSYFPLALRTTKLLCCVVQLFLDSKRFHLSFTHKFPYPARVKSRFLNHFLQLNMEILLIVSRYLVCTLGIKVYEYRLLNGKKLSFGSKQLRICIQIAGEEGVSCSFQKLSLGKTRLGSSCCFLNM
jgi:hypothetical protein